MCANLFLKASSRWSGLCTVSSREVLQVVVSPCEGHGRLINIDEFGLFKEDELRLHGKFVTAVDLELPAEGGEVLR